MSDNYFIGFVMMALFYFFVLIMDMLTGFSFASIFNDWSVLSMMGCVKNTI